MFFKKNKIEKEQIDLLVKILKNKANDFTIDEIKSAVLVEGYSKKIAEKVVKKIISLDVHFKLPNKNETQKIKSNDDINKNKNIKTSSTISNKNNNNLNKEELKLKEKEKQKALSELSKSISISETQKQLNLDIKKNVEDKNNSINNKTVVSKDSENNKDNKDNKDKDIKKTKPLEKVNKDYKKSNGNIFSKMIVGLKKFYFFFEDKYYNVIDKIDKKVKITPLVDSIDKIFPSFILFILILIGLIFGIILLVNNSLTPNTFNLDVLVVDTSGNAIKEANVVIQYNDQNIDTGTTDVFGETNFENLDYISNFKLIVFKEYYSTVEKEIEVDSENISKEIQLDIDTDYYIKIGGAAQTRELVFSSNNVVAAGKTLDVSLKCENDRVSPEPNMKRILNGRLTVDQPAGCGELRLDVRSTFYKDITNRKVPEDNKVILEEIEGTTNTGKLEVNIKGVNNAKISEANIIVYGVDDPSTNVDESQYQIESGLSDYYGRFVFDLNPGTYNFTVDKQGYLLLGRSQNYTIVKNNKTSVDYVLIKFNDLEDIDCSNEVLSQFCENDELDCEDELLQDYILHNDDGSCQIGEFGYVDVTLRDLSSEELVKGNISIWKKEIDGNTYSQISSRNDVNHTFFEVSKHNNYQIRVNNTEQYGYIIPEPVVINEVDVNKVIYLEYSSILNSGTITSNVKYNGNNVSNASVYLYYGEGEFEDTLVSNSPQYTNSSGDVNFTGIRSGKEYYTSAISQSLHSQGISNTYELDANTTLELNVNLSQQSKTLRLNVNTSDYTIHFYDSLGENITEFVVNEVSNNEKDYVFSCEDVELYAILSAPQYASYQTELITLIYGETIYKEVVLDPNLPTEAYTYIEYEGLYDETGNIEISQINLADGGLNKEYKMKFTYYSSASSKDLAYAFIRAGDNLTINEDSIYLTNVFAPGANIDYGCKFSGEIDQWEDDTAEFITTNLSSDKDTLYCSDSTDLQKWIIADFSASSDIVEFSINFKFDEQIAPISNYKLYYRSLVNIENDFAFEPDLEDWQDWVVAVPDCYFYAPSEEVDSLGFENIDYSYNYNIYDENNDVINLDNWNNILYIDDDYKYELSFIYFAENGFSNKSLAQDSENTLYNLEYNNYKFEGGPPRRFINYSGNPTSSFAYNDISGNLGYSFDLNTGFKANSFFSTENNPYITTNVFSFNNLDPLKILAYAYSKNDLEIKIESQDATSQNKIFTGDNSISVKIKDPNGSFVNYDVQAYYSFPGQSEQLLGTVSNGNLNNQNITVPQDYINQDIEFRFTSENSDWTSKGYFNNSVYISKNIDSGFVILHSDTQEPITLQNPLEYTIYSLTYNGNFKDNLFSKDYSILNYTSGNVSLEEIIFSGSNNLFNTTQINNKLSLQNSLPKNLELENQLTSYIILNSSNNSGQETDEDKGSVEVDDLEDNTSISGTLVKFSNILDLDDQQIIIDTNTVVNLTPINLSGNLSIAPGINYNEDGDIYIEFIKGVSENLTLDYSITNNSSNEVSLIKSCINFNNTNVGLNSVNVSGTNCNVNYNVEPSSTFNLDVDFSLKNTAVTLNEDIFLDLTFKIEENDLEFTYSLPINISILNPNSAFSINSTSGDRMSIYCKHEDLGCYSVKTYTIENKTNTYNLEVTKVTSDFDSSAILNIGLLDNTSINVPNNDSRTGVVKIEGIYNENNFYQSVIDLNFEINILENYFYLNKELELMIIQELESAQDTLADLGLTGDFCLGSGGVVNQEGIFILADCSDDLVNNCKTGSENLPNILFDWSNGPDWGSMCVEETNDQGLLEYNSDKIHCDSTQLMLSLIRLASQGKLKSDQKHYIYLMYDGISDDFIEDFSKYITSSFAEMFDLSILNVNSGIFEDTDRINIDKIIVNYDGTTEETNNPGKYEIVVNNDFILSDPSNLDITLKFVQEVPYSQKSLFLYLPIDGKVGYDSQTQKINRSGYGVGASYSNMEPSEIINLELNPNNPLIDSKLYPESDDSSSIVKISSDNLNNIYTNDFSRLQKTDSKLININLDAITQDEIYLNLRYSPNYIVPVYARAINMTNNNLSYNLKEGENNLSFNFNNLLDWSEYRSPNTKISDTSVFDEVHQNYLYSTVEKTNISPNNALLKSYIYLPMTINPSNFKLSLDTANNDENTLLYGVANHTSGSKEINLGSSTLIDQQINSIKQIFDQIVAGNACIYNGLANTYIKWLPEVYDFTTQQEQNIIDNFETEYLGNGAHSEQ